MYAPSHTLGVQSSINVTFGQRITTEKTPIDINLELDILSQKTQNIRFNTQQMLNFQINDGTLLIELVAKKGLGLQLADKIMSYIKSNQEYLKLNNSGELQIKAVGKGQICYLFINSKKFSLPLENISKLCKTVSQQNLEQFKGKNNAIKLQIKSLNNCQYLRKLLDNQGAMRAFFDSLSLQFNFQKNKLVQKVLEKIFEEINITTLVGPLKSFKNLNLSVNFSSASELDKYEKLRVFAKVINKIQTNFLDAIKGEYKDEAKLVYFDPYFSFTGKIFVQKIDQLFEVLFGQSIDVV